MLKILGTAMLLVSIFVTPMFASQTETAQVSNAKWFNGNWFLVKQYGVSPKFGGSQEGVNAYFEVLAQKKAYTEAKAAKDLAGMVQNAFWPSVQAWAYNNAANNLLSANKPSKEAAAKAKELLVKAAQILTNAPESNPDSTDNDALSNALEAEEANRINAGAKISSNLDYAKRILGELEWPKD
jgi:hypothetical protein